MLKTVLTLTLTFRLSYLSYLLQLTLCRPACLPNLDPTLDPTQVQMLIDDPGLSLKPDCGLSRLHHVTDLDLSINNLEVNRHAAHLRGCREGQRGCRGGAEGV